MADDAGREIARMDEMLELLYWFEGEGFAGAATLDGIARFLHGPPEQVLDTLGRLVRRGDVVVRGGGEAAEYRLTAIGRREGARRFAEEFAPLLSQGHGECSDPDCDCHTDPAAAAECHAARAHGGRAS